MPIHHPAVYGAQWCFADAQEVLMMARFFRRFLSIRPHQWCTWFLAVCWSGGLLSGILVFGQVRVALMAPGMLSQVSPGNLIMANLLPFLFSAFAVYIQQSKLILPIAFLKGCLFSFVSMGVMASFGSAGWLVRFLLMFSDLLLTVLLYFYWLGHISGFRRFSVLRSGGLAAVVALVASVDYYWVAPLLGRIL